MWLLTSLVAAVIGALLMFVDGFNSSLLMYVSFNFVLGYLLAHLFG